MDSRIEKAKVRIVKAIDTCEKAKDSGRLKFDDTWDRKTVRMLVDYLHGYCITTQLKAVDNTIIIKYTGARND